MDQDKRAAAIAYIDELRTMEPALLNALIVREAGEELALLFHTYSAAVLARDPQRVLETTSSLMLMGYLVRANEERRRAAVTAQA